jgi:transposase
MSKALLVITAVTVEKQSAGEVARAYGVARSWVYVLLARYAAEGDAAFDPRGFTVSSISEDITAVPWMVPRVGFEPTLYGF